MEDKNGARRTKQGHGEDANYFESDSEERNRISKISLANNSARASACNSSGEDVDNRKEDDEDEDGDSEDDTYVHNHFFSSYNPADFDHLIVSPEVKEMFQYIQRYIPQKIEIETRLRPFIPEYIAAVGDADAFLKVPRPDGKPDNLGLTLLDEPSIDQSDPTVLDLQLRAISKQKTIKEMTVKSLENPEKNEKEIDKWIKSITNLHLSKPPPTVHYTKPMPDLTSLMREWPTDFETTLKAAEAPTAQLNCSLREYVEIICAIMDIPVYNNRIESLHLLFSLYMEFKNSQHFQKNDIKKSTEDAVSVS
ncbi:unnamed protein product [Hydatigera taeniaeformis]|uniref:Intraflagellar transport protein 46 homolog n=1 Tax=Hydatigena taeniaeformis TaxID=6205 RepID=A0A0R3X348_HYDTA|nr:unnamed protein product [Hydatigera taeniaeformis]